MDTKTLIFINKDASNLSHLFLDEEWNLNKLFQNIYSIYISGQKLGWLVKVYDKPKYAKKESENLHKLQLVQGVPRILAVGLSKCFNYLIISQAPGLDLFEHVEKYGYFSEQNIKPLVSQMLSIIKNIHSKNIIHNDIKPENIIYDPESQNLVIIDFEGKSTDDYRSPEQVLKQKITDKTDIWSIGATIYYIIHGNTPFKSKNAIIFKHPIYSTNISDDFRDFLNCLMDKNINLRYNATDALNHFWITDSLP
jgi:serine/threonine protein kinase